MTAAEAVGAAQESLEHSLGWLRLREPFPLLRHRGLSDPQKYRARSCQ